MHYELLRRFQGEIYDNLIFFYYRILAYDVFFLTIFPYDRPITCTAVV